ncbi:hypothetical protein [Streptomyces yunnanensis]|uniref:hypothetical protein n=1 Tax=Streptomyces yunnanensis TaxID=156453 RepID=UPI00256FBD63|nr:hypothetical protein [Streptomyces yunnanensis]
MSEDRQQPRTLGRAWWQGRPRWVGLVTAFWGTAYAAFGVVCTVIGTPLFHGVGAPAPAGLDYAVVVVGALAALVSAGAVRYGVRTGVRALLWTVCGLSGIAAFGLLMDVIMLMFGQGVDSWAAAANHALAAVGVCLLGATARSGHRPPTGARAPAPSCAPARVQLAACAGTVAFLPYCAMKSFWAFGGTFAGTSIEEVLTTSRRNGASEMWLTLESWGLDATVLLAALGTFLLWGLVRPWGQVFPRWTLFLHGRRVPRWLPLAPALIGAATLAPYGVLGTGYCALVSTGVLAIRPGDFHSPQSALLVGWIGMIAFAGYGVTLAVATRSYWLRTRPTGQVRTGAR